MSSFVEQVIQEAAKESPNSEYLQAANAVIETAQNPSPINLVHDVELAISIISSIKARLDKVHPSIFNTIKALL